MIAEKLIYILYISGYLNFMMLCAVVHRLKKYEHIQSRNERMGLWPAIIGLLWPVWIWCGLIFIFVKKDFVK